MANNRFYLLCPCGATQYIGKSLGEGLYGGTLAKASGGYFLLLLAFASCVGFVHVGVNSESRWRWWLILGMIGVAVLCVYQGLSLLMPGAF